jgi:alkanesulfonate monooxygenase SsuD/methylene tetrahydromethanopterin reductase-like flavin-dependent oxidoreductase (luciferase family)
LGKRENLTARQLAQRLGGYSGLATMETSTTIADEMEKWVFTEGCDGFTVMLHYLPGGLDDFFEHVIPFGVTTKGRHCANISACRTHRIASAD